MRLRAHVVSGVHDWFSPNSSEDEILDTVDKARDAVILVSPGFSHKDLLQTIQGERLSGTRAANAVSSLLQLTPQDWSHKTDTSDFAIGVGNPGAQALPAALRAEEIRLLLQQRKQVLLNKGESRRDAFAKSFGVIVGLAKGVHVLDKYAATDIFRTSWMLGKLLGYADVPITIWTELPTWDRPVDYFLAELPRKIRQHLSKTTYRSELTISVFPTSEPKLRHARRIKFAFDHGALNVELDKGLATFDTDPVPASIEVATKSIGEFTQMKSEWAEASGPSVTYKWVGTTESRDSFGVRGGAFGGIVFSGR